MAQSFADWENQVAIDSITGGILGSGAGAGAISAETAASPLYANTRQQLLDKMGGNTALQAMFAKGLTPEQVLYGSTGTTQQNPMEAPSPFGSAIYNSGLFKNPNQTAYDPRYGYINTSGPKGSLIDMVGSMIPYLIMAAGGAATLNPGILGAQFAGGGLGPVLSSLFKTGGNALIGSGNSPGSTGGGAPATRAQPTMNPGLLLPLLTLLGLARGR